MLFSFWNNIRFTLCGTVFRNTENVHSVTKDMLQSNYTN